MDLRVVHRFYDPVVRSADAGFARRYLARNPGGARDFVRDVRLVGTAAMHRPVLLQKQRLARGAVYADRACDAELPVHVRVLWVRLRAGLQFGRLDLDATVRLSDIPVASLKYALGNRHSINNVWTRFRYLRSRHESRS